ncbi:AraC family transcriptional regulator [Psychromonas hadalis]|uniref:AraC family transcriptional regulator n=1 Tax=Psychromonas hadalis TaxID=211669 RepID=UPI0003B498EE|nr:AraC family transcriptional regulator [Psychromonas hadalis]
MPNDQLNKIKPAELILLPNEVHHHDHPHHQLVIAVDGHSEFSIEGLSNIITPGQGCVVTASSDHSFNGVDKSQILVLNLPLESHLDQITIERINTLFTQNGYFQLDHKLQKLIQLLVAEMSSAPNDSFLSQACNSTIIALLQRHKYQGKVTKQRINIDIIDQYIKLHISKKITVTQLAGMAFLGERQFFVIFKQQIGMTPHQYVLNKRFILAKKLLEESVLSLSEISSQTGFANQSSFTHRFTKLQGISPSQYRR